MLYMELFFNSPTVAVDSVPYDILALKSGEGRV